MTENYIYLQPANQNINFISTPNSTYDNYGIPDYQQTSGQNVITLPPISYQDIQKQPNYLNQNLVYNIPQSNLAHGHQNLGVEKYQQSYPQYTTQPQVKILNPKSNKIQQIKNEVPIQNYYQQTQPQSIPYQQTNIQQNPQVPITRAKVQQISQPQVPMQQPKGQQIIQPKINVQGQPIYQQNIIQNNVPQMDIYLQNIQDKPFFLPAFEPNLQLANLILSEPQIPLEIITAQSPEIQSSGQNPETNQNPQQINQQNNKKIVVPVRNPNINIKQYEQNNDAHFVKTNETTKAKTNTNQLNGYEDTFMNDIDRPTVGEGHGLFGSSIAVIENFDDNKQEVKEIKLKGANPGNNNLKSINPNEAKNIVNNQTSNNIPGKESLNTQKPIEDNNTKLIYGNNASPQNQRTESVTGNLDQLSTITKILQDKKETLPPPITKKYKK